MNCKAIRKTPTWMKATLLLAGLYNLVWGAWVVLFPLAIFSWAEMALPRYPQIWQCVGMIVGTYGLGYLFAAQTPFRLWPIVFIGLIGKILGPIGFLTSAMNGDLPWAWGLTIVTNDLIWWLPFGVILYMVYRVKSDSGANSPQSRLTFRQAVKECRSHRGATLAEISAEQPVLTIFLRHTGCTFCREAIDDISRQRGRIEAMGVQLAVVHMSPPMLATQLFAKADLDDIHRFSDRDCVLYDAFGLERGSFRQLLGPKVWSRGFVAGILRGYGAGPIVGDGFRLPGVFLLSDGQIVAEYRAQRASDRPDYIALASQARTTARQECGV
jgi:hypothetical protein